MVHLESPAQRLAYRIVAASFLAAAALALAFVHRSPDLYAEVAGAGAFAAFAAGKFAILYGVTEGSRLGPFGLAVLLVTIDLVLAVGVLSFAGPAERLPLVGPWMRTLRAKARKTLDDNPGLGNMAFFGVVLYVFLPFAATGSVIGSLAARLLGLSRIHGLLAVFLGSVTISSAFAALALLGRDLDLTDPVVLVPLILGAGVTVWWCVRRVRRILRGEGAGETDGAAAGGALDQASR